MALARKISLLIFEVKKALPLATTVVAADGVVGSATKLHAASIEKKYVFQFLIIEKSTLKKSVPVSSYKSVDMGLADG